MNSSFKISLKAAEKIYINGAVIRFDRKTSLEFLNDVDFLLESHIIQLEDANTPLRQLYFVVQEMLMEPSNSNHKMHFYRDHMTKLIQSFENDRIKSELKSIDGMVHGGFHFEAMKAIRALFGSEDAILRTSSQVSPEISTSRDPHLAAEQDRLQRLRGEN